MEPNEVSLEKLKENLLKEGINPSFQRLKIYEYVARTSSHPTVETIYNDLSKEIPTLSKTTIYNTLNLFHVKNMVSGLTIEGKEVRYDGNTHPHAHFKCTECGALYDIPVDFPALVGDQVYGHKVTERQFHLRGVCKHCLAK
jgi:Fur family transcriptional regulator, peroxide stress response regulator